MCALVTGVQTCALPIYPRLEDGIFRQGNLDWQADCECDVRPKPHAFIRNVLNPPKTDIGCPFHTGCAANGPDPQFTPAVRHRKIGRASCRESVCQYVWITAVAVSLKKR